MKAQMVALALALCLLPVATARGGDRDGRYEYTGSGTLTYPGVAGGSTYSLKGHVDVSGSSITFSDAGGSYRGSIYGNGHYIVQSTSGGSVMTFEGDISASGNLTGSFKVKGFSNSVGITGRRTSAPKKGPPSSHQGGSKSDSVFYGGKRPAGSLDHGNIWKGDEEWLEHAKARALQIQEEDAQALERKKKNLDTGSAGPQLKNVFADDAAWESPTEGGGDLYADDPNVVDLSGSPTLTPRLLRTEDGRPIPEPLPSSSATEDEPVDEVVPPTPIPSRSGAANDSNDEPIPPEPLPSIPSTKLVGDTSATDPKVVDLSGPVPEPQYLQVPWDQSQREDGVTAPGSKGPDRHLSELVEKVGVYAHMEPAQLDEIATQHSNNKKLQEAITILKEKIDRVNNCGVFSASELDELPTRREEAQKASQEVYLLILNENWQGK